MSDNDRLTFEATVHMDGRVHELVWAHVGDREPMGIRYGDPMVPELTVRLDNASDEVWEVVEAVAADLGIAAMEREGDTATMRHEDIAVLAECARRLHAAFRPEEDPP